MSRILALTAMLALAALAGCGGGSAPPAAQASALDRYDAAWQACWPAGTGSQRRYLSLVREPGASALMFMDTRYAFPTQDCSGEAADMVATTGKYTLAGSTMIGGTAADKFIVDTDGAGSVKQVFRVEGGGPVTLTAGRLDAPLDAEGFPTVLEERSLLRPGDLMRKYAGTWSACIDDGAGSRSETLQLTRSTDTSGWYSFAVMYFSHSRSCSGTGLGTSPVEGGFLLQGSKPLGADVVDKAILSLAAPAHPQKQVFLVRPSEPGTLWRGAPEGALDADGYPDALNPVSLERR